MLETEDKSKCVIKPGVMGATTVKLIKFRQEIARTVAKFWEDPSLFGSPPPVDRPPTPRPRPGVREPPPDGPKRGRGSSLGATPGGPQAWNREAKAPKPEHGAPNASIEPTFNEARAEY